jgi:hypothetical protein
MKNTALLLALLALLVPGPLPAQMRNESGSKTGRLSLEAGPRKPGQIRVKRNLPRAWFERDDAEGEPRLEIDRSRQFAEFFVGDRKVGQCAVATGRPGFETPAGSYRILEKERTHHSSLYGSFVSSDGKFLGEANNGDSAPSGASYEAAPMPYFMRLTECGMGLHQGFVPGTAVSHGCIRLPREVASQFYEHLSIGDEVIIR